MVIDNIRAATKSIHAELDESLMPRFQQIDSKDKYAAMLNAFYSYFDPVMKLIDTHLDKTYLPDYDSRRKPAAITDDLHALGKTVEFMPQTVLPVIDNSHAAFGALYVLEGSTLGGVYLSSVLAKNIPGETEGALSFFYGYGKESKEKWHSFIGFLNAFAEKQGNEAQIVNAAVDTFTSFKEHLQNRLQ